MSRFEICPTTDHTYTPGHRCPGCGLIHGKLPILTRGEALFATVCTTAIALGLTIHR